MCMCAITCSHFCILEKDSECWYSLQHFVCIVDGADDKEKIASPLASPITLTPARTSGVIKLKRSSTSDTIVTSSTPSGEKTLSTPSAAKSAKIEVSETEVEEI